MLTVVVAQMLFQQHLSDTPRANHSRVVAHMMRTLAPGFSASAELWEVVGLRHDLDYFHTLDNWSQHGLLTVRWLGNNIPLRLKMQSLRTIIARASRRIGSSPTC